MENGGKRQDIINRELTRIYNRDGSVKTEVLLEDNTPEDTPIHDHFEWDNDKAAHEHRLDQARKIIRKGRIITDDGEEEMLHNIRPPKAVIEEQQSKSGEYKPATAIAKNPDEYQRALSQATRLLNAAQRNVSDLRRAAESTKSDTLALITMYEEALNTANNVLMKMH